MSFMDKAKDLVDKVEDKIPDKVKDKIPDSVKEKLGMGDDAADSAVGPDVATDETAAPTDPGGGHGSVSDVTEP